MALNPFGVDITHGDDICIICHDLLNTAPTYTLPECKHKYHTNCIITWFRHRNSVQWSGSYNTSETDGRCPHCGNTGINNVTLQDGNYYSRSRFLTRKENELFKINKEYGRKKDAPRAIKNEIEKLSIKETEFAEIKKKVKDFKNNIKNNPVDYEETKKQLHSNKKRLWELQKNISRVKKRIAVYPIVPLIIPTPIDIN